MLALCAAYGDPLPNVAHHVAPTSGDWQSLEIQGNFAQQAQHDLRV